MCSQRWQEVFRDSEALGETQADAAERLMHNVVRADRPGEASSHATRKIELTTEPDYEGISAPQSGPALVVRETSIWDTEDNMINAEMREPHFNPLKVSQPKD